MIIDILLFIAGLAFLIKGADYFVSGGAGLAARFGVSPGTIGLTVIAFGTSLPEFVVSLNALAEGSSGIALGNIIGSNIANIALVLAVCAIIAPAVLSCKGCLRKDPIVSDYLMMIAATVIFLVFAFFSPLGIPAGVVFLAAFAVIIYHQWKKGKTDSEKIEAHGNLDYIYIAGGIAGVVIGSRILLISATSIAQTFGISDYVIGISMVAVGTSLPELATSLVAVVRGQHGISIGNILGSNIFNLLFVLGVGSLVTQVPVPDYSGVLIMAGFSAAAILLFTKSKTATRAFGFVLLALYAVYIYLAFTAI
ncbi:Na+/Ca+ antiporter, CaCA family [Methanolacinia petrolearia DSM 11571]|uniref:Na+/Ca+ antiporter, CaCA family n=1 Tax=Methanolacinia petrolearia (strain DSM 11571 / OCM 486 / SEBR 4847) TaxID=679926 RepID=E1RGF5_METP4|nr:calcium/sodium antiporter [Methanolacinia petrolearia]ADN35166.1 Na+/Ca+ antiporter, CaCA family [Methanolacinia petrolearia DSM 11571]